MRLELIHGLFMYNLQSPKKNMTGPRRKQSCKPQKLLECNKKPLHQYVYSGYLLLAPSFLYD
jgi:hypothetical protein